jgi:endonuclease YncB( thermonuclease family)
MKERANGVASAITCFIILFLLAPYSVCFASDLRGRVIAIADGDTFTLLTADKQQVKIRLAEIDAPESGQPYGNKSKQTLSGLIFGKDVRVAVQTTDRYGRTVGRPYVGDLDICAEMVRMGAAWAYREYLIDRSLLTLEADAKADKMGLWGVSEAQNVPPWEWRRSGDGNPSGNCQIKGNINSKGDRIYHVPGSRSYGATKIAESKGERWFCSEAEARAAGWRAP